ncbi:MFS transporter [Paractinoplanes durhamensis]|uniref:MFS transporter n=1 Tax=Paractinoplanes durhamensis TaxID=113563 RepID=A0ABQ3YZC9_9ACTN|nr:MFS transporter [Actinoplanes durhamensis]GIE02916.1 MFS transporter [Actinoplanes durhamensis]
MTFRDVFAVREYRAIYLSLMVNWAGDYLSKAAVTVLVYQQSESVLLSAAAFGVSFLPWIIGGTLLSALAERYPYRRVLIIADLSRMVPIALLLVPHMPVWAMLVLVFLASLGMPPTQAARSALLPQLVGREKLPTAIAINQTTTQAAMVLGYLAGATIATTISPRVALAADALTFALSAAVIARGVRPRPATRTRAQRTHLLHESGEGFQLVFGRPVLRSIALMVFVMSLFVIAPESLAVAWAAEGSGDAAARGLNQGLIMAANPIGFVVGGLLITRLASPALRDRLIRPFAILACLALVPAAFDPPMPIVVLIVAISGVAAGGLSPTLNGKFVLMLPHGYRARAFGVIQGGIQLAQFAGVMVTGLLADLFWLPAVVGLTGLAGTAAMAYLSARWPSEETFEAAIEEASATYPPADAPTVPAPALSPEVAPAATTSVTPDRPAAAGRMDA